MITCDVLWNLIVQDRIVQFLVMVVCVFEQQVK